MWCEMAGFGGKHDVQGDFLPSRCLFVDGGVLSNFPIDVFHNSRKVPTRPTFGVKLQWDERRHEIPNAFTLVTQTFNSARHCLDYEFIRRIPTSSSWSPTSTPPTMTGSISTCLTKTSSTSSVVGRSPRRASSRVSTGRYRDTRAKLAEAQGGRPTPGARHTRGWLRRLWHQRCVRPVPQGTTEVRPRT